MNSLRISISICFLLPVCFQVIRLSLCLSLSLSLSVSVSLSLSLSFSISLSGVLYSECFSSSYACFLYDKVCFFSWNGAHCLLRLWKAQDEFPFNFYFQFHFFFLSVQQCLWSRTRSRYAYRSPAVCQQARIQNSRAWHKLNQNNLGLETGRTAEIPILHRFSPEPLTQIFV